MDIQIGEVITELTIEDTPGQLSAAEYRRLVATVLEAVRAEQDRARRQDRDTRVTDRFFQH